MMKKCTIQTTEYQVSSPVVLYSFRCTDLHPLKSMHPLSTRSFDVVKTFGEVLMRMSRNISSQTPAGWLQYPNPVINEK